MKKLFLFFCLVFACFSCDSVLHEDARSIISADNFFKTPKQALSAVYGVYSDLNPDADHFNRWFDTYRNQSAGLTFVARPTPTTRLFAMNDLTPSNSEVSIIWQHLYDGIKDANLVINRVAKSSLDEDTKSRLIAETKFLRCYFYFNLTKYYGDVPYWTQELQIDKISKISKTAKEKIWAYLLKDLNDAESNLPDKTYKNNEGRVTKWAAKMLKARIYMWGKDWTNAIKELEPLCNDSPHHLLNNYGDIFRKGNELNDEIIFASENLVDQKIARKPTYYRPRKREEAKFNDPPVWFNGAPIFTIYQSFAATFSDNDIRKRYNVLKSVDGQPLTFIYMPKFMRVPEPEIDPLVDPAEDRYNSSMPIRIMRLGDAYLLLSEAENELNDPSPEAYKYINAVRNRAGLSNLSGLTQQQLRKAIRRERKWELAGEGEGRKMDLIRWGIYVETVKELPQVEQKAINNDPSRNEIYSDRAIYIARQESTLVSKKNRVLPIPAAEIGKDPNLTQNPLWK